MRARRQAAGQALALVPGMHEQVVDQGPPLPERDQAGADQGPVGRFDQHRRRLVRGLARLALVQVATDRRLALLKGLVRDRLFAVRVHYVSQS